MRAIAATSESSGITFTFPGQGSYSYRVLSELYTHYPQTAPYFEKANEIGRNHLGGELLSLVTAGTAEEHDKRLNDCAGLDQIGIYLTEVLIARILIDSGVQPSLLVGHSFGELAALAVGGAYSFETGVRIVCHRLAALQSLATSGIMAAISCGSERAKQFVDELGHSTVEISVINHPRQTVLSGEPSELEALGNTLNRFGVTMTRLNSRYPFHSSFLRRAVTPFRNALHSCEFRPSVIPVFLCMEGSLYSPGHDLSDILSSQLVRTLHFMGVVRTLYDSGYRVFIECGAGDIVTKLIGQNLTEHAGEITTLPAAAKDVGLQQGLSDLIGRVPKREPPLGIDDPSGKRRDRVEMLQHLGFVTSQMAGLVETASHLIEELSAAQTAASRESLDTDDTRAAANTSITEHEPAVVTAVEPGDSSTVPVASPVETSDFRGRTSVQPVADSNQPRPAFAEECREIPVAIVSMGCVFPGAVGPDDYWSNILNGVSGISNLADSDPSSASDFLAVTDAGQVRIVSDKTYTLLHGSIIDVPYNPALLSRFFDKAKFDGLTKGQKLLATAVAQSLSRLGVQLNQPGATRIQCILGGTADGSKEHDEALFLESMESLLDDIDEPRSLRDSFSEMLESISGYKKGDADRLRQHKIYASVVETILGAIPTFVVDTACSSSLYSTYLGIRALQDRQCDLVLAGGVFAPGPANNTLFAQFRGLTSRESRPFDAAADGVVFGDGAGIVILKRLPDALEDGDQILAVIRGVGLSSDGKSPSINVPQAKGQGLAIRAAYEDSGIDINTVQYVEAHATATLVGDAVEFSALK
ncbi:MAG TPA: beta-ketoacyl synthase N-terminal-like domain-containing protein, partial [Blastocatellia bacterium]|nr:beta-ketoacyl synthase N-terminal-like domain-containing protein [Blastocatellia bacterium]